MRHETDHNVLKSEVVQIVQMEL
jgi:hypothetical protein